MPLTAKEWNERYRIGQSVHYHPVIDEDEGKKLTYTTSRAFVADSGHTVIFVEAEKGFVALEAVRAYVAPLEAAPMPEEGTVL